MPINDSNNTDYLDNTLVNVYNADLYNRVKTSHLFTIFDFHHSFSDNSLLFENVTATGGTVTLNTTTSAMDLAVTTTSGSSVIRQSKKYAPYLPGRTYSGSFGIVPGAQKTNNTKRWGLFDAEDGLYFENDGSNTKVVLRSNTTGSVVNTPYNQSAWNLDKLDGTGSSQLNLDLTKHVLYIIEYVWHGAGKVRFGVMHNGTAIYCHEISTSNLFTSAYCRKGSLPFRVEIFNTGTTASSSTLKLTAGSMSVESDELPDANFLFSANVGRNKTTIGSTALPIISIRPKTTFSSVTNRVPIFPQDVDVLTNQVNLLIFIILNPTLTGASFTSVATTSAVEYDISATAYTGGTIIWSGLVSSGTTYSNIRLLEIFEKFSLSNNIAGTTTDIMTVVGQSLAGNTDTFAAVRWKEYQ